MRELVEVSGRGDQKPRWSRVAAVATRQCSVISLEQLLEVGFTYDEIRGLVKRGLLFPLHRGVFAVGHRPLLTKAYLFAALLAAGPNAFLSHRAAAAVWGLREVSTRRIDVTVRDSGRQSRGTLRFHRTRLEPDVKTRDGLRVSSVPQMLIELAPSETRRELDRLITLAVRKGILDIEKMRLALARHANCAGVAKLTKALAGYVPTADRKSELERDFDELLAEHPEIPPPQRNIFLDGWEVDCYWPEQRLAVELDGRPYHVAVRDMEKDKFRDAKLLLKRIRTMRITDMRFRHDRAGVYDDLVTALSLS